MKPIFICLYLFIITNFATAQIDCNSWVKLENRFSAVTVGDLDVTGNQITVEALFNMTGPSVDIVSKHWGGFDVNYLLRPVRGEIATDISGFVTTNQGASSCNDVLEYNKIYHAALVYDGSTLKFYRNGALISSVPCQGNLVTNNWNTAFGEHALIVTPTVNGLPNENYHNSNTDESFRGYINEVKIWNVARTQEQIQQYMYTPLPNPTTQAGLVGYWTLNSLQNKQGNVLYNGTIEGSATIGQTSSTCAFVRDSCNIILLPVKVTNFDAYNAGDKTAKLTWQTEDEISIKSYIIQRSEFPDFKDYIEVGSIVSNQQSLTNHYSFSDNSLAANKTYYYRLQINEDNGLISFTGTRIIKTASSMTFSVDIYPNPVGNDGGVINLKFINPMANADVILQNDAGQILVRKKVAAGEAGSKVTLDISAYARGSYFISVLMNNDKIVKKIIKQ